MPPCNTIKCTQVYTNTSYKCSVHKWRAWVGTCIDRKINSATKKSIKTKSLSELWETLAGTSKS